MYTYDIRSVVGVYTPVGVVTEWLWSVHSKLECTLRQGKGHYPGENNCNFKNEIWVCQKHFHIQCINAPCDLLDDRSTMVHAIRQQTIAWTNAVFLLYNNFKLVISPTTWLCLNSTTTACRQIYNYCKLFMSLIQNFHMWTIKELLSKSIMVFTSHTQIKPNYIKSTMCSTFVHENKMGTESEMIPETNLYISIIFIENMSFFFKCFRLNIGLFIDFKMVLRATNIVPFMSNCLESDSTKY